MVFYEFNPADGGTVALKNKAEAIRRAKRTGADCVTKVTINKVDTDLVLRLVSGNGYADEQEIVWERSE